MADITKRAGGNEGAILMVLSDKLDGFAVDPYFW